MYQDLNFKLTPPDHELAGESKSDRPFSEAYYRYLFETAPTIFHGIHFSSTIYRSDRPNPSDTRRNLTMLFFSLPHEKATLSWKKPRKKQIYVTGKQSYAKLLLPTFPSFKTRINQLKVIMNIMNNISCKQRYSISTVIR